MERVQTPETNGTISATGCNGITEIEPNYTNVSYR
jgi:hypothetical protein